MSAQRKAGASRSLWFFNTLLLSSAIALPALAQVEQVVVTAQRTTENIQDVPIQVSAFSSEDLAAHQITMAKDLQFATPNVTYTKTNFSGDDFTIRGIGNDVITGGGKSGVSVSFDNVYLAGAALDLSSFFDLERVEVLEGPQSTLYGRGAAAGSVNIIPAKPDLETFSVTADASYGNYSANEDRIAVNIPIVTDELGMRFALDRNYNGGIIKNTFDNGNIDSDNTWSVRGSLRWEPTQNTIIDIVGAAFHKAELDDARAAAGVPLRSERYAGLLEGRPDERQHQRKRVLLGRPCQCAGLERRLGRRTGRLPWSVGPADAGSAPGESGPGLHHQHGLYADVACRR